MAGTLFWTRASEPVTAARLYTTLALVILVTNPLYFLIQSLGKWSNGFACILRIHSYLNLPEMDDTRTIVVPNEMANNGNPVSGVISRFSSSNPQAAPNTLTAFAVQIVRISVCMDLSGSILTDVSMDVPVGGVTMILGPVGSGKSTLLKAMLGEAKLRCGTITVASRSIAYCSQVPWIVNDTIQSNILGTRPYNAGLYNRTIHICALDVDLARLPDRDQTMAGSQGCNLSGGQKQRVVSAVHTRCIPQRTIY